MQVSDLKSAEKLLSETQKHLKQGDIVDPVAIREYCLVCIQQGVIADQKYNLTLRKCVAELLKLDSSCIFEYVIAACSLAPGDWRAASAFLEVMAKFDAMKTVNCLPGSFLESAFVQLASQDDRSGLVGRFLAATLVQSEPKLIYDLVFPHLQGSSRMQIMTYFVTPMLKLRKNPVEFFAEFYPFFDEDSQVSILKAARGAGLDVAQSVHTSTAVAKALRSLDHRMMLNALELVCSSTRKLTAPIPPEVFVLLTNVMDNYLGLGEPRSRADAIASLRHLLDRVVKSKALNEPQFLVFLNSLHTWCMKSLRPGCPYRYQIMVMLILSCLKNYNLLDLTQLVRPLIGCVASGYNDIRECAISLMPTTNIDFRYKAFELVRGTRSSETGAQLLKYIGPSVKQEVISELSLALDDCLIDIEGVAAIKCIHGLITTLRLFAEDSDSVSAEEIGLYLDLCKKTWRICAPYSFQRPPRQVLDFCWKAVKEACELVAVLDFSKIVNENEDVEVLEMLCNLLTNTTHWGALAAVPAAFIKVGQYNGEYALGLARRSLESLESGGEIKETTRRSAGLPMLMQAALMIQFDPEFVEFIFRLAEKDDMEIAVHGMNCVKGILNDRDLTSKTNEYVERALKLAMARFDSAEWPLRNCAAMLFSTLLRRIFGPKNTPVLAPSFFHDHRSIHNELVVMLGKSSVESELHSVYPALALLTRMRPNCKDTYLQSLLGDVVKLLGSRNWQVRAMAAQAMIAISLDKKGTGLSLIRLMSLEDQNQLHGLAVAAAGLLKDTYCDDAMDKVKKLVIHNPCLETNISLYALYTQFRQERLVDFKVLTALHKTGLNPSIDVFEGMQSKYDVNTRTLMEYANRAGVLRQLPLNCWTLKLAKAVLEYNHPPDVHALSFKIELKSTELHKLAISYALDTSKAMSVRHAAVEYACAKNQRFTEEEWYSLMELLSGFAESDDIECKNCAVTAMSKLSNNHQKLVTKNNEPLCYSLLRLLSDDDEGVRKHSALLLTCLGECNTGCEKLVASKISREFMALKLVENLYKDAVFARDAFLGADLFLVERDGQYRDEIRGLEILQEYCFTARELTPEEFSYINNAVTETMKLLSTLNFEDPFNAGDDPDLVLIKKRTETIAALIS